MNCQGQAPSAFGEGGGEVFHRVVVLAKQHPLLFIVQYPNIINGICFFSSKKVFKFHNHCDENATGLQPKLSIICLSAFIWLQVATSQTGAGYMCRRLSLPLISR